MGSRAWRVDRTIINIGGGITADDARDFMGLCPWPVILAAFRVRMERVMARPKKVENAVQAWTLPTRHACHREHVILI